MMFRKKIKKWNDGDSGTFMDGTKFRLANVRANEKHQFGGSKATKTVAGMTGRSKGQVRWNPVGRDTYRRQIGEMSNKDGSINKRMRTKGYRNKGR